MNIKDTLERIENPGRIQTFDSLCELKENSPDRASDTMNHKQFIEFGQNFIEKHLAAFQELAK
jgi:CRISPR/Cas system type I-B associated protein Csh2 (Cas7 group RAMP superfamily)